MATLTDLQTVPLLLSYLFGNDPKQSLIQALAWFDPISLNEPLSPDDDAFDAYAADEITVGLHICRACFPAVFAGANALLMQNAPEPIIKQYLCEGMNAHLVTPITSLEEARYGPPLECYGIDATLLSEGDESDHPMHRTTTIFTLFGISFKDATSESSWSRARTASQVLQTSLENRPELIYQDLASLLAWLFSTSGNSLVDWSQEEMWDSGAEMPTWSPDEVEFVNEMTHEAQEMMIGVWRGLTRLEQEATLRQAFARNLKVVFTQLDSKGKKKNACTYLTDAQGATLARRVKWPERDDHSLADQANAND